MRDRQWEVSVSRAADFMPIVGVVHCFMQCVRGYVRQCVAEGWGH